MNMKQLKKQYFSLDSKVEIYLPTRKKDHSRIDKKTLDKASRESASLMSSRFGGCTMTHAAGFWEDKTLGETQLEEVSILYSYASRINMEDVSAILALAESLRDSLEQEAIMVVVNGTALFV